MAQQFYLKQGDLRPPIQAVLSDANGVIPLAGATVKFAMRVEGGGAMKVDAAAAILDADAGLVQYQWQGTDTDTAGTFDAEFQITIGGQNYTVPNSGYIKVFVAPDVAT